MQVWSTGSGGKKNLTILLSTDNHCTCVPKYIISCFLSEYHNPDFTLLWAEHFPLWKLNLIFFIVLPEPCACGFPFLLSQFVNFKGATYCSIISGACPVQWYFHWCRPQAWTFSISKACVLLIALSSSPMYILSIVKFVYFHASLFNSHAYDN